MPLRAPPFRVSDRAAGRRPARCAGARAAAFRGRAHQPRRARSRGARPRTRHRRAGRRGDPAPSAGRQRRRHAGAGARRSRCCAWPLGAPSLRLFTAGARGRGRRRRATSSRRPRPTARCASTFRRTARDRFVSAVDVLRGPRRSRAAGAEAGADRRDRPRAARGQEHAARRVDAGGRDPRAAAREPVRPDAARPARRGRRRSRRSRSCCSARCSSSRRRAGSRGAAAPLALGCASALLGVRLRRVPLRSGCCSTRPRPALGLPCCSACCWCSRSPKPTGSAIARAPGAAAARARRPASPGELDAAKRIQMATLPRTDFLRGDPRVDLAATMVPAREVGGDLYDFFRLDDRRLFFLVGDVAGKGLSASIFMAVSKALYKSTMLRAADGGHRRADGRGQRRSLPRQPGDAVRHRVRRHSRPRHRRARLLQRRARQPVPLRRGRRRGAPHRRRRRAAAVRGRRFRLRRGAPADAARRVALRGHRRRDRGAATRGRALRRPARARSSCCGLAPRDARTRARRRRAARGRRRLRRRRRSRPTTSRCWCCAGTVPARRSAAPAGPRGRSRPVPRQPGGSAHEDLDAPVARLGDAVGVGHQRLALAASDGHDACRPRARGRSASRGRSRRGAAPAHRWTLSLPTLSVCPTTTMSGTGCFAISASTPSSDLLATRR